MNYPAAVKKLLDAKRRAESASAAKSRFLALVSHEIRTLLYGMLASIELIGKTHLDELQTQLSTALACSARTLKDVLNNTLEFTRNESGIAEAVCLEFDLPQEIESATQAFRARASLKGLQLHCWSDPALAGLWWGDALKLRQILNNLLNNAVKFTATGGSVTVAGKLIRDDAPEGCDAGMALTNIALSVRDTGPGIAQADVERIFALFAQGGDAASRSSCSGAGLGLYLCRQFAAAMDGAIELVSTPAGGSTFTLRIALQRTGDTLAKTATIAKSIAKSTAKAKAAVTATAAAAQLVISPRRQYGPDTRRKSIANVLIVDDHSINRLLLQQQLLYFGCKVTLAASGSEALALERYFDLILTDLNMPGLDGYTLARIWRATGVVCPIIAIAAGDSAKERERCRAAGINGHLTKPFTMGELEELLGQRIGLYPMPPETALSRQAVQRWQPETMRIAVAALTADLAELAQCTAASDIARLGKVVHRIHGGMALLDMRPAAALCRAIEECIEFEWTQEALQLTSVLWNMLTQIREDIDPGDPGDTSGPVDVLDVQ